MFKSVATKLICHLNLELPSQRFRHLLRRCVHQYKILMAVQTSYMILLESVFGKENNFSGRNSQEACYWTWLCHRIPRQMSLYFKQKPYLLHSFSLLENWKPIWIILHLELPFLLSLLVRTSAELHTTASTWKSRVKFGFETYRLQKWNEF